MTQQQELYYKQQQFSRMSQLNQLYVLRNTIGNYVKAGIDPMTMPELSAQYLYLDGLGFFAYEQQDPLASTERTLMKMDK